MNDLHYTFTIVCKAMYHSSFCFCFPGGGGGGGDNSEHIFFFFLYPGLQLCIYRYTLMCKSLSELNVP